MGKYGFQRGGGQKDAAKGGGNKTDNVRGAQNNNKTERPRGAEAKSGGYKNALDAKTADMNKIRSRLGGGRDHMDGARGKPGCRGSEQVNGGARHGKRPGQPHGKSTDTANGTRGQ